MTARALLALSLFGATSIPFACSSTSTNISNKTDAGSDATAGTRGSGGSGAASSGGAAGSGAVAGAAGVAGSTGAAGSSGSAGAGATAGSAGAGAAAGSAGTVGSAGSAGRDGSAGAAGTGGAAGAADAGGCPALPGPPLVRVGGFCIDRTEVTNAQYEQFLTAKGSNVSGQNAVCTANTSYRPTEFWPVPTEELALPVGSIDWCDAFAYCKWAGKRLCGKIGGGANAYADFKDATKSQWFNACSSGGRNSFPYGSTFRPEACNGFNGPHGCNSFGQPLGDCTIQPVASLTQCQAAGSYAGVFDLSGNVLEWEDSCATSPDGGPDNCRMRGGSLFARGETDMSCDTDTESPRNYAYYTIGFRCCY